MSALAYQIRWALPVWLVTLATAWFPENRVANGIRGALLRPFLGRCGKNFQVGSGVILLNTFNLMVGDDVYVAHGAWLNAMAGLTIEDEVMIGPYVVISTNKHAFRDGSARFGGSTGAPVRIGRGTWLAGHVSVAGGVRVGAGNLVAANACVVGDTRDGVKMGGVPARELGPNEDGEATFHSREDFLGAHRR